MKVLNCRLRDCVHSVWTVGRAQLTRRRNFLLAVAHSRSALDGREEISLLRPFLKLRFVAHRVALSFLRGLKATLVRHVSDTPMACFADRAPRLPAPI